MAQTITLNDTEWHEITGLTADSYYFIQSQNGMFSYSSDTVAPTTNNQGIKDTWIKFKKGIYNTYVRATNAPTILHVEEI